MIDIHCHILPEVDDGAYSLEESLRMARLAAGSGVGDVFATSHFPGHREALDMLPRMMDQLALLKGALEREKIGLRVHPGAEILCLPGTAELAERKWLPTLGISDYVLVEFYFDAQRTFMDESLWILRRNGYRPVVAHPERYEAVQADPRMALRWFEQGYVLQVNKGSPLGAFGSRARRSAERLLEWGVVHVLASDAHGSGRRTPDMEPLADWCWENLGEQYTEILLQENPGRILKNQPMRPVK